MKAKYIAIALVSSAILVFEIAVTRVMSVVLWYHFAFLALSLAMLGLGAPGVWFALQRPRPGTLRWTLLLSGVAAPVAVLAIVHLGGFLVAGPEQMSAGLVVLVCGAVLAALLTLGSAVCLLLMEATGRRIGWMYGADLLGATVGAVVVVPLLSTLPTPLLLAAVGLLPLTAAFLVDRRGRLVAAGLGTVLLGCLIWGEPFALRYTKNYRETRPPLYERWTPTARLTVLPEPVAGRRIKRPWSWGMGRRYRSMGAPPKQLWLEQDGSAGTPIETWDPDPRSRRHLLFDVSSVAYQLRPPGRVCVIGAGGGRDVLAALTAGATHVDAVELNAGILSLLTGPLKTFTGNLYHHVRVRPVIAEGRAFLTRTTARYDVIQLSVVDSYAATAAGAYALSESYLYTVEAFQLYWRRLAPHGILSVSRWMMGRQQLEVPRLALLAVEALREEGVADPRRHLAVARAGALGTLLVSRAPFSTATLRRLDQVCAERGFERHWPPHARVRHSPLVRVLLDGPETLSRLGFDVSPPTDDRPFFFQTVYLLGGISPEAKKSLSVNERSVTLVRGLILGLGGLTLVLFFLPFALRDRLTRGPGFWRGSGYFAAIGLGFMLVEIPWIQRFVLYLGHPSYATTVVLAGLLCGAGCGSLLAACVPLHRVRRLGLLLPLCLAGITLGMAPLFQHTLGWPLALRVFMSFLLLIPAGLLLGFAFPVGMRRFGDENKPWFWAINGTLGVLGSVSSLALSMILGFTRVALIAVAAYLAAYALLQEGKPSAPRKGTTDSSRGSPMDPPSATGRV